MRAWSYIKRALYQTRLIRWTSSLTPGHSVTTIQRSNIEVTTVNDMATTTLEDKLASLEAKITALEKKFSDLHGTETGKVTETTVVQVSDVTWPRNPPRHSKPQLAS